MQNYRHSSHSTYDIKYHLVWITKYRKAILTGIYAEAARDIIRDICKANDVEILKGHISKDHIHLLVSAPPHIAISRLMQYIKGKSSYKLMNKFKDFKKHFWGRHMWARGYFVATSGTVTDEIIAKYISEQDLGTKNDDFSIGG